MITSLRAAITEYPLIRPLSEPVRATQAGMCIALQSSEEGWPFVKLQLNFCADFVGAVLACTHVFLVSAGRLCWSAGQRVA